MGNTKEITDAAIAYISKMPKLTTPKLGFTTITDHGLRTLAPISKLDI